MLEALKGRPRSVAPLGLGCPCETRSRGCASLHPWLLTCAPSGRDTEEETRNPRRGRPRPTRSPGPAVVFSSQQMPTLDILTGCTLHRILAPIPGFDRARRRNDNETETNRSVFYADGGRGNARPLGSAFEVGSNSRSIVR